MRLVFSAAALNNCSSPNYLQSGDLQAVLQDAARAVDEVFMQAPQAPQMDMNTAKDNIIFQLVNTKQNEDMLRDMPQTQSIQLAVDPFYRDNPYLHVLILPRHIRYDTKYFQ